MTYIEWMDELKKNLLSIPRDERERVASYFSEIYADKRDAGFSERQIIEEFGPPYDAAKRVLGEDYSSRAFSANENDQSAETYEKATPPRAARYNNAESESIRQSEINGSYYGGNRQKSQPRGTYRPQPAPVFQPQPDAQPQFVTQPQPTVQQPTVKKPSAWKIFWKIIAILILSLLCVICIISMIHCIASTIFNAVNCINMFASQYLIEGAIGLGTTFIFAGLTLVIAALAITFGIISIKKIKALNAMYKEKI